MTIKEFDIESMGTPKEPSKLKSRRLNVRLTEADMETVRRNCAIAGYKSISRFVIASIVDVRGRGRTAARRSRAQACHSGWTRGWRCSRAS